MPESDFDSAFAEYVKELETPRQRRSTNRTVRSLMANELAQAVEQLSKSIARMNNLPPSNVVPYVGRGDKRSFQIFIKEFNKLGTSYGWSNRDLCKHVPMYFKNEASAIYDELTDAQKRDWTELVDEMASKLGAGDSSYAYRRQMQARKQRESESYAEFGQALSELADKAYPDNRGCTADMRKNLIIDVFLNGVKIGIREHLRRRTRPASLPEAIAAAMEEEELFNDLNRERVASEQISFINNLMPVASPQNFTGYRNFPPGYRNNNQQSRNYFGNSGVNYGPRNNQNWQINRENFGNFRGRFNRPIRGNRNNYGYNMQNNNYYNNNRPNFNNRRGLPSRRRGQGGYKINTISNHLENKNGKNNENNENHEKSKSNTSVSQTFLPFLTIIMSLFLLFFQFNFTIATNYQICKNNNVSLLLAPPENFNCSIPSIEDIMVLDAEVIVRRVEPIIFPIFKCIKKVETLCSFSIFKIYTNIPINETFFEKVSVEDCWQLITDGKLGGLELMRSENDVWTTKAEAGIEYKWLGKECNTTTNFIVEKGIAATKSRNSNIVSDMANFKNVTIEKEFFVKKDMTFIWHSPPAHEMCDYQSIGNFQAIVTDKYIVIDHFQSAFGFSNKEVEDINVRAAYLVMLMPCTMTFLYHYQNKVGL